MSSQDWRIGTTASDYLRNQDKRLSTDERRPVIRKASDLVGPGIGAAATRVTNYNDVLATFNGWVSSETGAESAPNPDEPFTGAVVNDDLLGGTQTLTGMVSGNTYRRLFIRNPSDPDSLGFTDWVSETAVASIVKLQDWPLTLAAATWTVAPVQNPLVRGTALSAPGDSSIYVARDGWYDVRAQCSFSASAARVNLRVVAGTDPTADIIVMVEGDGALITPSLNGSALTYLLAETSVRLFVAASSGTSTTNKFLSVSEA